MREYETATSYGKSFTSKMSECDEAGCPQKSEKDLVNLFLSGIYLNHMQYAPLKTLLAQQQALGIDL